MRLAAKAIVSLLLVLALAVTSLFYFSPEKRAKRHYIEAEALKSAGDVLGAVESYEKALKILPSYADCRTAAAYTYHDMGNYTKAEYHLNRGIEFTPGRVENYVLLSKCYIEQDKLMDAVNLLDNIIDPVAKRTVSAARPGEPVFAPPGGTYSGYTEAVLSKGEGEELYVGEGEEYPSVRTPYEGPVALSNGETRLRALSVSAEGLISPLADAVFIIQRVVEEVEFQDPGVERLARMLIGAESGPVYSSDLWSIGTLENKGKDGEIVYVESLSDLVHFKGLKTLSIYDTPVDIGTMPELSELETLSVVRCGLTSGDLEFLPPLPSLTSLDLSDNRISSISKLKTLPKLQKLNLRANGITDVDALIKFSSLRELDIGVNAIKELNPLMLLVKLEHLAVDENSIETIRPISALTGLLTLDVSENQITDLSPISGSAGLASLRANGNRLTSLAPLSKLYNLRELSCDRNEITSLKGIEEKPLVYLSAMSNRISSLAPVSGLKELETLVVTNNIIESLEPLGELYELKEIRAERNNIKSVTALVNLTKLEELHISENGVEDSDLIPESVAVYR